MLFAAAAAAADACCLLPLMLAMQYV
jgi:hypothetical protein